jgi:lipoprotein-anchoring transpeptidase ErfK/SrfK
VVDKSDFRLYWIVDQFLISSYPVAIGKRNTPTPSALWIVGQKYIHDRRSVYGPRRLRLYRIVGGRAVYTRYGIHGTNRPGSIGKRASHGCIRLYNKDILQLWSQVRVGDFVITQD